MSLTFAGWSMSGSDHRSITPLLILAAALAKAGTVGWRFMELHAAHALWKAGFLLLITGIVGILYLLA